MLLGSKGSAIELIMNSLYFDSSIIDDISMSDFEDIEKHNLTFNIPIYKRFYSRGFPIVGTTIDYFYYRELKIESGRLMGVLGEVVIGSKVASKLSLSIGDHIITTPENLFDLTGVYPLKMKISGILEPSFTADDNAIFTDIKTSWVIQGLGHGHQDVFNLKDKTVISSNTSDSVVANAKLVTFSEITEENLGSFHFHGDSASYPISAIISVPNDTRSGTILRGRYQQHSSLSLVKPEIIVRDLLDRIYKIKQMMDSVLILVSVTVILALVMIFSLSIKLRDREMKIMYKFGCSRFMVFKLLFAEISLIILGSSILSGSFLVLINYYNQPLIRFMLLK
ncbi:hypothetical protein [Vibrio hangzhouensis]|uniref:hypothetical protein n=1 Tax=Vibrio hangzhouensis TaxID=462991 RepID=UPI00135A4926|nr:hypothetical protein [Vibrio hangzhouensis]